MGKWKRRYYYGYRKMYARKKKKIYTQFFKTKIDHVDEIAWTNAQQAQPPYFRGANTDRIALQTILEHEEFERFIKIFSYYKIYAYSIECKPVSDPNGQNQNTGTIIVGYNPISDNGSSFDDAKISNHSMILSSTQNTRIFRRLQSATGYLETSSVMRGSFYVQSNYASTFNNAQKWTLKISLYVILKNSKT